MPAWLSDWIEAERGRWALLLPVAMGAAILLYFALPSEPPLWLRFLAVALAATTLAAGWSYPPGRLVAALALAAALGFMRAECRTAALPPLLQLPDRPAEISGRIVNVERLATAERITIAAPRLDGGPALPRGIRIRLRADDATPLGAGDEIEIYAWVFGPGRPAYPGGWDAGRQDFFSDIGASGFALGKITVLRQAGPGRLASGLQNLRAGIARKIMATLPPATGAIAVTLLTGDEQAIPAAERQNFIAAGLAHILAVAGLHVGIVMGLAFAVARFGLSWHERLALRLPAKPIAAALALLFGAAYALLTGAHLPILRSLAMASLVTLGVCAGRRAISLRGLALAALLILGCTPEAVLSVSFQMSFSAVLALIAGYAAVQHKVARHREGGTVVGRLARHIAGLALTSLLAGGASMPFAAYQFQQIQPYWIPANLLAVPLTAFWIMPWGLLSLGLMPFGLGGIALIPMGWGIGVIVWLTARIAACPDAMLRVAPMPDAAILLIAAGLIWLCIWRSVARVAGIALILSGLAVALTASPPVLLVSADARLIAIRAGGGVDLVQQGNADAQVLAQWAPVWRQAAFTHARCTATTCLLGPVLFATMLPPACPAEAKLIVSPVWLHGTCANLPALDRFWAYANGATEVWIGEAGLRIRTDRAAQGRRPWVVPYPRQITLR